MSRHLARGRLYRSFVGTASLPILCGIAFFAGSHHFAV
jgi:hypothetical protein